MSLFESLEGRQHFYFGAINANFGTAGIAAAPTIGAVDTGSTKVIALGDGKTLVAAGNGMARFTSTGTLDTTFGNSNASGLTIFKGIAFRDETVDSSGRIYVLATGGSGTLVLRYTASGQVDSGFGTNGTALVEASKRFRPKAIEIQSDGKLVVAGSFSTDNNGLVSAVYRLSSAGAKDTAFGTNGSTQFTMAATDLITPQANDTVADLRILSGGKIEVLGSSYNYLAGGYDPGTGDYNEAVTGNSVSALVRLNANGSLDTSFGSGGVARRATFDNMSVNATAGVIRTDGSAVVATTGNVSDDRTVFVGFNSSGRTAFNPYVPAVTKTQTPTDATALGDGRVAFIGPARQTFTVTNAGIVSNVVTPIAGSGSDAITTNANGDLTIAAVQSTSTVKVAQIDAGALGDPRPDDLPAAAAVDTAVDSLGGLHVAYFDVASKSLKYAYRNAQGYWAGIRTVDATAGAGAAISIATTEIKGRTNVAIAYYDSSSADLRIANSNTNGRKFSLATVASKGAVGISPSLLYTDSGGFAVTYYSKSTGALYYALNNGDGWATEVVDDGGAGEWNELQFDPQTRRPAIAYSKGKTVMYAFKGKGSTWADARAVAVTTTGGAAFINLAIPNSVTYYGGPKISYYDLAGADLTLATYDRYAAAGKRWSTHTIASRGSVGAWNEIVGPYYDATLFAYNRNGDSAFQYDYSASTGTAAVTPLVTGGGKYLSVALDAAGGVGAIAYVDTTTGLLFVR